VGEVDRLGAEPTQDRGRRASQLPTARSLSPPRPGAHQAYALAVSVQMPSASTNWSSSCQAVAGGVRLPKLSVPRHTRLGPSVL
jgi:hypothetical protein